MADMPFSGPTSPIHECPYAVLRLEHNMGLCQPYSLFSALTDAESWLTGSTLRRVSIGVVSRQSRSCKFRIRPLFLALLITSHARIGLHYQGRIPRAYDCVLLAVLDSTALATASVHGHGELIF